MVWRRWEHFAHDADMGVRGIGGTLAEAFEQAALALMAIVTDAPIASDKSLTLACKASNRELLFVEWLNAVIYEMATTEMLFGRFSVTIEGNSVRATLWGEPLDVERHKPACEPKGATLTMLRVAQEGDGSWLAQCVVDV
jgi:SHS2 domain-containing protein